MRFKFALLGPLVLSGLLSAQEPEQKQDKPKFPVRIERVRLGFRSGQKDSAEFKVGMWTPVFVDITAGPKGVASKNPQNLYLEFTCNDSEGVGASYRVPLALLPNESRTVVGYIKPGNYDAASKVGVTLHWDGDTFHSRQEPVGSPLLELGGHLYLSLGSKTAELLDGYAPKGQPDNPDTGPRHAAYESNPQVLPEHWFGYQGVDLIILSTDRKEFLTELLRDANQARLQALAQWVRRGGRLIIPVHYSNQDLLAALLQSPVWQPAVPVIPPANPGDVAQTAVRRLEDVEQWAGTNGKPFPGPGEKPVAVAHLSPGAVPGGVWNVLSKTADGRPLITRMPYGRGSIVYMAFSLDQPPFTRWAGRQVFFKRMIDLLAPEVNKDANNQNFNGRGWQGQMGDDDITSQLQRTLDNFDVNVIDFGFVALFIILYILVVGPLDYFVLKYVFNKLEWTWITFPTVVLAVSIAAYFTAYALKGHDLKINKVDVVDFDLRTEVDDKGKTQRAFAYGQTFFTILSPRIQNYTIGVEVQPGFWNGKAENPLSTYEISWLGRPDRDGPGAMGRSGSQGFFRRPYAFADEDKGIVGVPIPVWTTKAFTASWEAALPKIPFEADLEYHTREFHGMNVDITGTIKNTLPVDLEDVWLIFDGTFYPLSEGLKSGGAPVKIFLKKEGVKDAAAWANPNNRGGREAARDADFRSVQGTYDPTSLVRQAMFYERYKPDGTGSNHSLRFLDLSWRLTPPEGQRQTPLREVILYGHVPFQRGAAAAIQEGQRPLPTSVWLGRLPQAGETRPALSGAMAQDTYIRVLLPVRLNNN